MEHARTARSSADNALGEGLSPFWFDSHEAQSLAKLLQPAVPLKVTNLNQQGLADFAWFTAEGRKRQWEHKQCDELLTDIDAVEEQLVRQIPNADETGLFIEGLILPMGKGTLAVKYSGTMATPGKSFATPYTRVVSWFWQLERAGVDVVIAPTRFAMAEMLVAMYKADQKAEHTVLHRHIKPRVFVKDGAAVFKENPQLKSLMGLQKADIGEKKAKVLLNVFGSIYEIFTAPRGLIASLPGFGKQSEQKLWDAIGRD